MAEAISGVPQGSVVGTYFLPHSNPPNTQTLPTVSTTKYLGIVLNTRLSAEDNVNSAANKARGMLFYLKRSFAALTPCIFLPLYKTFIRPHLEYAIQATNPMLCRDAEAPEKVQKLALKFVVYIVIADLDIFV